MRHAEKFFTLKIGSNLFVNTPVIILYKGKSLFRLYRDEDDGTLGIDFELYDKSGQEIAVFKNGKVVAGDVNNYVINNTDDDYSVTETATGRLIAEVKRDTNGAELEITAEMYMPDGKLIKATPTELNFGPQMSGCEFHDNKAAIVIN